MNRRQTIIFDFDGTLADTQKAIKHVFLSTLQNIGIPVPSDNFIVSISSLSTEGMFRETGITNEDLLKEAIFEYCRLYQVTGPQKARRFPGVLQTLKRLRKLDISLAIATNEKRKNLESLLPALKIDHLFDFTICEDEVSRPKPHPEMVYKIMDKIEASPDHTLIVGDSTIDISMGKATHCKTCAVTYGAHPEKNLKSYSPDWLIDRFDAVMEILEGFEEKISEDRLLS